MSNIKFNLSNTLEYLGISMNKLTIEMKTRPALVLEVSKGQSKAIKFDTLERMLDVLNAIAKDQGKRRIVVSDIFDYVE